MMNQVTKAQLTIGILACFAMAGGLVLQALEASNVMYAFLLVILQLVAIFVLSIILLGILEWMKIFDLKTNALITIIVIILFTIRLTYIIVVK